MAILTRNNYTFETFSISSSSSSTSTAFDDSAMRIRSRYLQKLGVANFHEDPATTVKPRGRKRTNSFVEPLKTEDYEENAVVGSSPLSSSPASEVSFESSVVVHPIASHVDYSDRIRNALWTDSEEMKEEMKRNCIEFIAEGWDWKQVVEEDEFNVCQDELVHPVHALRATSVKDRFLMRMKDDQTAAAADM